jgi:molecular chaperone GrpE
MTEENNKNTVETSEEGLKNSSESKVPNHSEKIEEEIQIKSEEKPEEIKQLEEKEHHELEYFSKEKSLEDIKNLEKELTETKDKAQKLQKENDEAKKKYMHLQAEFENAQKRWNKSRQELNTQYTASVLKNFLPLYDSFKKAIETANETEKIIINGFFSQFMGILKSYGAEPIEVKINDPFDYNLHEALTTIEKEDFPENSILEIVQDGFKYGKEVIRYTKVVVSRKPKPPKPKEEEIEEADTEEKKTEDISEEIKIEEKKSKKHKKDKEKEKSA